LSTIFNLHNYLINLQTPLQKWSDRGKRRSHKRRRFPTTLWWRQWWLHGSDIWSSSFPSEIQISV